MSETIDAAFQIESREGLVFGIPILKEVMTRPKRDVKILLGSFGQRLRDFAKYIDLDHPDIVQNKILGGKLGGEFSERTLQLFQLYDHAVADGLTATFDVLCKAATSRLPSEFKLIGDPLANQQMVRLISNQTMRKQARYSKKLRPIHLDSFSKRGESYLSGLPSSFRMFHRYNDELKHEIEKAQKKAERFRHLGCTSMAEEIEKSVENSQSSYDECHYGFHRISVSNAALIYAKGLGYEVKSYGGRKGYYLAVPSQSLKEDIHTPETTFLWKQPISRKTIALKSDFTHQYAPSIYPIHEILKHSSSLQVMKLVEFLDEYPGCNYKPLFDHYFAIVPSVEVIRDGTKYGFCDSEGKQRSFSDKEEAQTALDMYLLSRKLIQPIVLGEVDGKCYFICHWE